MTAKKINNALKYLNEVYKRCSSDFLSQTDVLNNKVDDKTKASGYTCKPLHEFFGLRDVSKQNLLDIKVISIGEDTVLYKNSIKWSSGKPTKKDAENLLKILKDQKNKYPSSIKRSNGGIDDEIKTEFVDKGVLTKKEVKSVEKIVKSNVENMLDKKQESTNTASTANDDTVKQNNREFLTNMKQEILDSNKTLSDLIMKMFNKLDKVETNQLLLDTKINLIRDLLLRNNSDILSESDIKTLLENIETIKKDIEGLNIYEKFIDYMNNLKK